MKNDIVVPPDFYAPRQDSGSYAGGAKTRREGFENNIKKALAEGRHAEAAALRRAMERDTKNDDNELPEASIKEQLSRIESIMADAARSDDSDSEYEVWRVSGGWGVRHKKTREQIVVEASDEKSAIEAAKKKLSK